jgi:putative transposase
MEPLCFKGYLTKRFARYKEFCNEKLEVRIDEFLNKFCNSWLEEEFTLMSGAEKYERNDARQDRRNGHYWRRLITGRGVIEVKVPRGERGPYQFSLFEKNKRKSKGFDDIVVDALLKGLSTRKASEFFANAFGSGTISHQAASSALKRYDLELEKWRELKIKNNAIILVLDAVHLKGSIATYKQAKPVLFAYAVYENGIEEVLDFKIARGESLNAWHAFCSKLKDRGLENVQLIVHDDNAAISEAINLVWPKALDQQCVFHVLQNMNKKLKGCVDKKKILKDVSYIYEQAESETDFYRLVSRFKKKWRKYRHHAAIEYLMKMAGDSIQYFHLPKQYWRIAKTSNRLERLFEELKRRIKVFRRFPNPQSCRRWLYALLKERKKVNLGYNLCESQQSS